MDLRATGLILVAFFFGCGSAGEGSNAHDPCGELGALSEGCPLPTSPDPCGARRPEGEGDFVLGTGRDAFQPVCQGDALTWVAAESTSGNGGAPFHMEGGLRVSPALVRALGDDVADTGVLLLVRDRRTRRHVAELLMVLNELEPTPSGGLEGYDLWMRMTPEHAAVVDGDAMADAGELYRYSVSLFVPGDGGALVRTASVTSACCRF